MAFGQFVCWVCGAVPWAMLEATLTMSVGQIVCWCGEMVVGCCRFPWAMPKATLTMAVGQLCVGYVGWCSGGVEGNPEELVWLGGVLGRVLRG